MKDESTNLTVGSGQYQTAKLSSSAATSDATSAKMQEPLRTVSTGRQTGTLSVLVTTRSSFLKQRTDK